ncbi:unnamed protein product [Pieris macdunnoughi]|uniref:PEP-utilising enzyme mobile domain-containing protein n=1 Tax=Pieris macdunnoughi TaxID=345717 RepID=A0A821NPT7_9NEOP|nr:unnamed protein product [Pieris macdunnoughi]
MANWYDKLSSPLSMKSDHKLKWVELKDVPECTQYCVRFEECEASCVQLVGGKGASLALLASVQHEESVYRRVPNTIDVNLRMLEMSIHGHRVADDAILSTALHRRTPARTDRLRSILDMIKIGELRSGDILITASTDIGWSPYFPLLAGIVTELGGLISHGAVIAREYGLPCVVGAGGATNIFSTGDTVRLTADGIVETVSENS